MLASDGGLAFGFDGAAEGFDETSDETGITRSSTPITTVVMITMMTEGEIRRRRGETEAFL